MPLNFRRNDQIESVPLDAGLSASHDCPAKGVIFMPSTNQNYVNELRRLSQTVQVKLDHVTICGSSLASLEQNFAQVGFRAEYGGRHTANSTHMSLVSFEDGTYLELVAPAQTETPPKRRPRWSALMASDAGLAAWASRVDDIYQEARRLSMLGIHVASPVLGGRTKPDGTLVEWLRADVGQRAEGAVLPFLIQDRTPRSFRVQPVTCPDRSGLVGIEMVVLGVRDLAASIELFRIAYGWPLPHSIEDAFFDATLAHFPGTPVVLAGHCSSESWLSDRLERFGELPAALLVGTYDLVRASRLGPFQWSKHWFGRRVAWSDPNRLNGIRLGVVERI
jgi:hypothetical protein